MRVKKSAASQGKVIQAISGRNTYVKVRGKYVAVYQKEGKEYVFTGITVRKTEYKSLIKDSRKGVTVKSDHRGQRLREVKKVKLEPSVLSITVNDKKAKKGTTFLKKLKSEGIDADFRKKNKVIIIKTYTHQQKKEVLKIYNSGFKDIGKIRRSP